MLDFEPASQPLERSKWRRAVTGVATSSLVHLALLALIFWVGRPRKFELTRPVDSVDLARRAQRQVNMVYLTPPPARPRTLPPTIRQGPEPPHKVEPPTPPAPPTPPPPTDQRDKTPDPASEPSTVEVPAPLPDPTTPTPVHHIRSLAFHPGEFASPLTRPEPEPTWRRPPDLGAIGSKCVPGPPHTRAPNEPITYGVVAGRVYQTGSREPLAGAVLSVMGTPYQTTSDSNGEYVLRFDADLLGNCQVQNVRVTRDGFLSQLLVLSTGGGTSDVNLDRSTQ